MPTRRQGTTQDRHFRADDALYGPARAKAKREGRSLSWIIRHALRLYLANRLPLDPLPEESGDSESPSP